MKSYVPTKPKIIFFQLFADLERLRVEIADRESDMRRNVAESEEADKKKAEREKEFKKNFEATRQKRTDVSTNMFTCTSMYRCIIEAVVTDFVIFMCHSALSLVTNL